MSAENSSQPKGMCHKFISDRIEIFEQLKRKHLERLASLYSLILDAARDPISCTLPNGSVIQGTSFSTTPKELLQHLPSDTRCIAARVDGIAWDINRPLEKSCSVNFINFDEPDGKHIFWHSSAHILGQALERFYEAKLCSGPPIEHGFYYDVFMGDRTVISKELSDIRKLCLKIIKERQKFERVTVSKSDLLDLFKDNIFKLRLIEEKVGDFTTVYRCGTLVDLCQGPHVENTGVISALAITKNSSAYWKGVTTGEPLQRIYGISFPTNDELNEWIKMKEEAEKRDHRKIAKDQELFFFHELSPGSCFFLPKGAFIYNKLIEFIKVEYRKRGFTEVISPNIYNIKLWKTSGHYENYAVEDDEFAMKPMNCPGHCLMYGVRPRSWKELPLRFADFGVLHRNEFSGALSGLTRVRRFCQDDAHIFCTLDQVEHEIMACLDFLFYVNKILGFVPFIKLSTKPEKYIGDDETWERAENKLKMALDNSGNMWELNEGDGAFYGPKIDIQVRDALGRLHQLSTIQLDFNLPRRFQLKYVDADDKQQEPVMIHRAILGSLERVIGVLAETYAGKWPFWLNPSQFYIVPIVTDINEYAHKIHNRLIENGFTSFVNDDSTMSLNKKIRNATLSHCNFTIILGKKELDNQTISLRSRNGQQINDQTLDEMVPLFKSLADSYSIGEDLLYKN